MIPKKCINCMHHKTTYGINDIKINHDSDVDKVDYCDYIEYFTDIGVPVPYPYFFKSKYPCKGHAMRDDRYYVTKKKKGVSENDIRRINRKT